MTIDNQDRFEADAIASIRTMPATLIQLESLVADLKSALVEIATLKAMVIALQKA